MSAPHESKDDDERLVSYLLSLLPADEAERLDEASIVDGQFASRLRVVEDDLVDAYVRRRLPDDTRRRFETVYLTSARRRQKVAFAEHFVRASDGTAGAAKGETFNSAVLAEAAQPGPSPSRPRQDAPTSRVLRWRGLAMAAMLILATAGGVFVGELRVRGGLNEARTQSAALERRARDLEQQLERRAVADADTARELARARSSLAALTDASVGGGAGAGGPGASRVVFVLTPPTRAAGPLRVLKIPTGSGAVSFGLQLEVNDFPRYGVVLKEPSDNRAVWRSPRTAARSSNDSATVTAVVPADALTSQSYVLELSGYGADAADEGEVIGAYPFRIVRQ